MQRALSEALLEHDRRQARAAHAEQDEGVDHTGRADLVREPLKVADPLAHPLRLVEPAEPLLLTRPGPHGGIAGPDPLDQLLGRDLHA